MTLTRHRRWIWLLGAFSLFLAAYAFYWEPSLLLTREFVVADNCWPAPVRVVVAGDTHFRPEDSARLLRTVAAINAADADLVLLVGDYFAGREFSDSLPLAEVAAGFGKIRSRHGVYAILGNHDWWCGGAETRAALETAGVRVLDNESAVVEIVSGCRLNVAGVSDPVTRRPNWVKAMAHCAPGVPTILLMHEPDYSVQVPDGAAQLVVAGHTHGGQVRIPWFGAPVVPSHYGRRFADGLVREPNRPWVFVTRGVGNSILSVRFNCPPEIAVLDLQPVNGPVPARP